MSKISEKNLARDRAQFAYQDVVKWDPSWRKEALARAQGLPIQTRTQGLTITLATLMREQKVPSSRLADLLGQWLLEVSPVRALDAAEAPRNWSHARRLLDACMKAERSTYQAAQTEALAFLDYVKLYANALDTAEDS